MNFIEFRNRWIGLGTFNVQQLYAWKPDFNRFNLNNWLKKGYIVKLRKEWYAFEECLRWPDFHQYVANKICSPSYISLYSALSHYGMVPEEVAVTTSVTAFDTKAYENAFGNYRYQSVRPDLMFGYMPKPIAGGRSVLFATPEKALLDLLYLNPVYSTPSDMLDLRLDEDYMSEDFDTALFQQYCDRTGSTALKSRVRTLLKTYEL